MVEEVRRKDKMKKGIVSSGRLEDLQNEETEQMVDRGVI